MAAPELTAAEERLVERYLWMLDFVGRCAQAIDEGHWHYLWDKAGQLEGAAARLGEELARTGGRPKVRGEAVLAGVRYHGRHYRACRLLHPARIELTATEVGSLMLAVADASVTDEAVLERVRRDALAIAERTDVRPDQVAHVLCALRAWQLREEGS